MSVRLLEWEGPGNRYLYKSCFYTTWGTTNGIFTYIIRFKEPAETPEKGYPKIVFEPYYSLQGGKLKGDLKFDNLPDAQQTAQYDYNKTILGEIV